MRVGGRRGRGGLGVCCIFCRFLQASDMYRQHPTALQGAGPTGDVDESRGSVGRGGQGKQ